jgi:hypothetical protein
VRTLEIIAVVTAILTALYWWNTRPRRRVAIAARRQREHEALTQEAREIYASAVAGSSVFEAETGQNPVVVGANNGNGEHAAPENLPLAARLPRALAGNANAAPAESTSDPTVGVPVAAAADERSAPPARPNPRPTPRRMRSHSRARRAVDSGVAEHEE